MYLTTDQERTLIPCGEAVPKFKHSGFWKELFFLIMFAIEIALLFLVNAL